MSKNIANSSVGLYLGGMKQEDLDESTTKQIIIATFDMAEEAFDCKALNTLILSTPKKNIIQAVGRIMRQKKTEQTCIPHIIDIVDTFSNFKKWSKQRKDYYIEKKYPIKVYDVICNNSSSNNTNSNNNNPNSTDDNEFKVVFQEEIKPIIIKTTKSTNSNKKNKQNNKSKNIGNSNNNQDDTSNNQDDSNTTNEVLTTNESMHTNYYNF